MEPWRATLPRDGTLSAGGGGFRPGRPASTCWSATFAALLGFASRLRRFDGANRDRGLTKAEMLLRNRRASMTIWRASSVWQRSGGCGPNDDFGRQLQPVLPATQNSSNIAWVIDATAVRPKARPSRDDPWAKSPRPCKKRKSNPCAPFCPAFLPWPPLSWPRTSSCNSRLAALSDLGGADLPLRLSGHRPHQPPAGAPPPRRVVLAGFATGLVCSLSSARRSWASSAPWSPGAWPSARALRFFARSFWTCRCSTGCAGALVESAACFDAGVLHARHSVIFFTVAFSASAHTAGTGQRCVLGAARSLPASGSWSRNAASGCLWPSATGWSSFCWHLWHLLPFRIIAVAKLMRTGCVKTVLTNTKSVSGFAVSATI